MPRKIGVTFCLHTGLYRPTFQRHVKLRMAHLYYRSLRTSAIEEQRKQITIRNDVNYNKFL